MTIIGELVNMCSLVMDKNIAIKGARIICRYFGGMMIYVPKKKKDGYFLGTIREILNESLGEHDTDLIINKIMSMGAQQIYIPMEQNIFRNIVAEEIYTRHYYENIPIRELCRDYMMSFTLVYTLWKIGRKIKLGKGKKNDHHK